MTDRFGKELNIGDKVVCLRKNYREMVDATVTGLTAQKIRVEYVHHSYMQDYLTWPNDVIKKPL